MSTAILSLDPSRQRRSSERPTGSEAGAAAAGPLPRGPLRVAVVGCGYWGAKHVRVLSSLSDVAETSVVEPDEALRASICATYRTVRSYARLKLALPHVDAVVIATPASTHAALALQAIRAGKHVLIEKPVATSLKDACRLVAEAERARVVLMAGHTFEFNPAVRELRRRIQSGELGKIYYIHSSRLSLGLHRSDVNVVWDLAPHDISIMNYLLGSLPTTVQAWASSHIRRGVMDLAHARLDYSAAGVVCHFHVSWLDPRKVRQVTVVGSKKMAVYDDLAEERLRLFDRGVTEGDLGIGAHELPISYRYGDIVAPYISIVEPLRAEDQHFIECIRNRRRPEADGVSAAAVVGILAAIDRSVRRGKPCLVKLPPGIVPQREFACAS